MTEFKALLTDLWREACRHIEIDRAADTLAWLLVHQLPIDQLRVWSLDLKAGQATLRAVGPSSGQPTSAAVALPPADARRLQAWSRRHEILTHTPGDDPHPVVRLMLGGDLAGHWALAPLAGEHGGRGALLLRAQPPQRFGPAHLRRIESLIEPFSVALDNDDRLRELQRLRETAEADKRAALARLGREDLSGDVLGAEGGLRHVMERVALVAHSDLPVLILGETGSGKEVIARALHDRSPRRDQPFIRVNCGAIPPDLIDSELFGHEKGSFTGATAQRRGWFERADQGTLLLDEVGELLPPAQVRLLRVVQECTFERVGGEQPLRVNVRIIAATHRDLPAMVQQRQFREDLWYRIAGFPIVIPPLRERPEDIPALAEHFAQRASRHFGLRPITPTADDLQHLRNYNWPGNIRELASVLDRAAILGNGQTLEVAKALGSQTALTAPAQTHPAASHDPSPAPAAATLDDAIRRHIREALRQSRGRIEGPAGAARRLAVNPHTLRAKMRKLGIHRTNSEGTAPLS